MDDCRFIHDALQQAYILFIPSPFCNETRLLGWAIHQTVYLSIHFSTDADVMVTSFSNGSNFFLSVFKVNAQYNFFFFLLAQAVIKEFSTAIYHSRTELMPKAAARGNQFPRSVVIAL